MKTFKEIMELNKAFMEAYSAAVKAYLEGLTK